MPETEKFWIESYGRVALGGEPVAFENYSSVLDKYFQVSAFQPVYRQFACIFREITDRVKAEQERRKLETQLRQAQKLEAIGTLAGGIAHDFNNILAAILGYAEIAREDSQPDSSLIGDIDQIIVAGNRARALVQQILAFSRQAEIEQIPLRLSIIAREAIKLLRSSLPSTIRIIADIDHETGLVLADPTQVHQVLMNLCTNAYHAMEKQGGVLRISLRQRALAMAEIEDNSEALPGEYVQLTVTDTGPGIPPEIRDRIFDPYFTTKEQGKGTGLGLAIVRGIVIGCGGFITCRSTVGEGSEFCASLPAIKREEKPGAARQADAEEETGSETILFVDDEEMLVSMGVTMLQRMGYRVTGCSDSRAALELFRQTPRDFDLVITDQTMPYLTGIDLAAAILEIRPEMPIILCTGYSNLVSEEKAMAAGIKGFAIKPLTRKDVATMIRMVLKQESDTSWTEPVN
jgi:signal transduction histidine kinase/CheY-like chemotaxis protein